MFMFNKPIILKTKPQFIKLSCNYFLCFFLFILFGNAPTIFLKNTINICNAMHIHMQNTSYQKIKQKKNQTSTHKLTIKKTTWTHKFHNSKTISYFTPRPNHYASDKHVATWSSRPYHMILILTLSRNKNKFLYDIIPLRLSYNKNELPQHFKYFIIITIICNNQQYVKNYSNLNMSS